MTFPTATKSRFEKRSGFAFLSEVKLFPLWWLCPMGIIRGYPLSKKPITQNVLTSTVSPVSQNIANIREAILPAHIARNSKKQEGPKPLLPKHVKLDMRQFDSPPPAPKGVIDYSGCLHHEVTRVLLHIIAQSRPYITHLPNNLVCACTRGRPGPGV